MIPRMPRLDGVRPDQAGTIRPAQLARAAATGIAPLAEGPMTLAHITAAFCSAANGNPGTARAVLEAQQKEANEALFDALSRKDPAKVRAALDSGADPNAIQKYIIDGEEKNGTSPIFIAAKINGKPGVDILKALLKAGATFADRINGFHVTEFARFDDDAMQSFLRRAVAALTSGPEAMRAFIEGL